jgi:protein-S-isoprenylcysteine O-methyltransferase Ste14
MLHFSGNKRSSSLFRVITAALLIGFAAHRGYYTRKVRQAEESIVEQPAPGVRTQIANVLALPALLSTLLYVIKPAWLSGFALSLPAWLRWVGVGVAAGGFGLLQWAQQSLGQNWSDTPRFFSGQNMVASGPYQQVRHPIYSAFLLILGSLLLITANWLVGGLWILITSLDIASRMQVEERMMLNQFGEAYRFYMKRTGRLLPRIRKL